MNNQHCRHKCGKCHKCRKNKHKKSCKDCRVITKRDFLDKETCKVSKTYVIDKPGKYCLGENIDFEPTEVGQEAIKIISNDVKLDLCCNKLEQVNDNISDVVGVRIGEPFDFPNFSTEVFKRITVTNGTILKFTGSGISATNVGIFFEPKAFEDLTFTDLNILECGSSPSYIFGSGIDLEGFVDYPESPDALSLAYKNIIIERCKVNNCIGNGAIQVFTGDNVLIKDCQANNLSNNSVIYGTFAYWITSRNLQMFNCQGNGTTENDPGATFSQAGGGLIGTGGGTNAQIKNCQFNDSFGIASSVVNTNLSGAINAVFENCQFNNSRGGADARLIAGVHISDMPLDTINSDGLKFINCQFNESKRIAPNLNPDFSGTGGYTSVTARNIIFDNCEAQKISTVGDDTLCFGFITETNNQDVIPKIGNVRNIVYKNCVAADIKNNDGAAVGFYVAIANEGYFGEQPELKNVTFDNCIASDIRSNTSDTEVTGIYYGVPAIHFDGFYGRQTNLFVKNCRVCDVFSNQEAPSPLSAGILTNGVLRPVICDNSVSDCDRGILLTGTDDLVPDNIFQLAATQEDTKFPAVAIDLDDPLPAAAPAHTFENITHSNEIDVAPSASTVNTQKNIITSPVDLNGLDWDTGDAILYDTNGGDPILPLVDGTTYYLIVSKPGYTKYGIVQDNKVDNCLLSGYEDVKDTTDNIWVNNNAYNNGPTPAHDENYKIQWSGVVPVLTGDLASYPTGCEKAYNLSFIP